MSKPRTIGDLCPEEKTGKMGRPGYSTEDERQAGLTASRRKTYLKNKEEKIRNSTWTVALHKRLQNAICLYHCQAWGIPIRKMKKGGKLMIQWKKYRGNIEEDMEYFKLLDEVVVEESRDWAENPTVNEYKKANTKKKKENMKDLSESNESKEEKKKDKKEKEKEKKAKEKNQKEIDELSKLFKKVEIPPGIPPQERKTEEKVEEKEEEENED
jgi:hypothetical protein